MQTGASRTRQTAGYFGAHVALGLMSAVLGPTLPALAAHVGSDPEALGLLFMVRALGYMLASLLVGRVYDRRPAHPVMVGALIFIALGLGAVPLMPSRATLVALTLAMGLAQGVLDVGNNMSLSRIHGAGVAPYMNALHCSFGVGALIAPLVVGAVGDLNWSYWALALAMIPAMSWLAATPSPSLESHESRESADSKSRDSGSQTLVWLLVIWLLFCQGAESTFGGWIYTVAVGAGFSEVEAARLVAGFWGAFTVGRLLAIPVAARLRPRTLLSLDIVGGVGAIAVLLAVTRPGTAPSLVIWAATLGLGVSLASLFPGTLSLVNRRLGLDGAVASKLFVGASVGSMVMPWVAGYSLGVELRGPLWLVLGNLLAAGAIMVIVGKSGTARD
ncbi:MAG: MFS transporter [Myxococcales bacterium]|nr:MFS transporter [Myxococcales bacterium]